jgi:hypothetical protein
VLGPGVVTMPTGVGVAAEITALLEDQQDLEYEQEISRNPYALKSWWRYLRANDKARSTKRYIIYER